MLPSSLDHRILIALEVIDYSIVIEGGDAELEVVCLPRLSFTCAIGEDRTPEGTRFAHIEAVTADFRELSSIQFALPCNWKGFSEHILTLPQVQKVIFGFKNKEDLSLFTKDVIDPAMADLARSDKLILAVYDAARSPREGLTWTPAFRVNQTYGEHVTQSCIQTMMEMGWMY